jgi:hypothetical protein
MLRHSTMIVVALLAGPGSAAGVGQAPPPAQALATAKSISCTFPVNATGTWKAGEPAAETKTSRLTVQFAEIDVDDGTARLIGNFGPSTIIVRLTADTLHFVQAFRDGPLYTTTIFPKPTRDGRLQAVHSRHEFTDVSLPGFTSRPEQYYGDCALTP